MAPPAFGDAERAVLRRYAGVCPWPALFPLGNAGGFSGARLWRVTGGEDFFCLRAWPPSADARHLEEIHRLMGAARAAGLAFVPAVFPAADGRSWVADAGRLWELTAWMPGRADFHA